MPPSSARSSTPALGSTVTSPCAALPIPPRAWPESLGGRAFQRATDENPWCVRVVEDCRKCGLRRAAESAEHCRLQCVRGFDPLNHAAGTGMPPLVNNWHCATITGGRMRASMSAMKRHFFSVSLAFRGLFEIQIDHGPFDAPRMPRCFGLRLRLACAKS